jgi:hypothetical protein
MSYLRVFKATCVTSEDVPRHRDQGESALVLNPAAGTLEFRSYLRSKVERALRCSTYCFAFRLYLRLPGVYWSRFMIERWQPRLETVCQPFCNLLEFSRDRHAQPPRKWKSPIATWPRLGLNRPLYSKTWASQLSSWISHKAFRPVSPSGPLFRVSATRKSSSNAIFLPGGRGGGD